MGGHPERLDEPDDRFTDRKSRHPDNPTSGHLPDDLMRHECPMLDRVESGPDCCFDDLRYDGMDGDAASQLMCSFGGLPQGVAGVIGSEATVLPGKIADDLRPGAATPKLAPDRIGQPL